MELIQFAIIGIPSTVFLTKSSPDFNPWQIALSLDSGRFHQWPVSGITIHLTNITGCPLYVKLWARHWCSESVRQLPTSPWWGKSGFSRMTSSSPAIWNRMIGHPISPENWRWQSDPLKAHCHYGHPFLWTHSTWSMIISKATAQNFYFWVLLPLLGFSGLNTVAEVWSYIAWRVSGV